MLSERITELFGLLQCTNSDIARFSGFTPSNISRLKSGSREPEPGSRTIVRLVRGICRYADYENMLNILCGLCGTEDTREEVLIPSLISWLYSDQKYEIPKPILPKSRQEKLDRLQYFSERLDKVMTLLDYSNSRLAADLNVDTSLISRYRTGIYHPNRNIEIKNHLSELIFARAARIGRLENLAVLCEVKTDELVPEILAEWLYGPEETRKSEIAESIFHSIDSYSPGSEIPANVPELPSFQKAERYRGTDGLRSAVVRFLTETVWEGGELLLYSDEPLDWMASDPEFFTLWAYLMTACLGNNVHIRVIHNIDRGSPEMVSAIKGWFPLYLTGRIDPYIFKKSGDAYFHHTFFLHPGHAGILGFFPKGSGEERWYDYITDEERLNVMRSGFNNMIDRASPFLKSYPAHQADVFWTRYHELTGKTNAILRGLSAGTMSETLLERMLSRTKLTRQRREKVLNFCRSSRENLRQILVNGELHELICLPTREDITAGRVNVNFEAETDGVCLAYTSDEFAEHLSAVQDLVRREKNYHLTLLLNMPFQDLQVFTMKDAAAVVRCRDPYTAFVFYNEELLRSVDYYCEMLAKQYTSDRTTIIQMLEELKKPESKKPVPRDSNSESAE